MFGVEVIELFNLSLRGERRATMSGANASYRRQQYITCQPSTTPCGLAAMPRAMMDGGGAAGDLSMNDG